MKMTKRGGAKKIRPLKNDLVAVHGFRLAPTSLNPSLPDYNWVRYSRMRCKGK